MRNERQQKGAEYLWRLLRDHELGRPPGADTPGVDVPDMAQIARLSNCDEQETRDAFNGLGPVSGCPEPRVLHSLCGLLRGSYKDALLAFGHLT